MPNILEDDCLGETGTMISRSSQNFVARHLYVDKGACHSICAKFMCGLNQLELPTKDDYLEAAQWIQSSAGRVAKVELMASAAGLRHTGTHEGSLLTDELYLSRFLDQVNTIPTFYIFGFWNNVRTEGHALLFYRWAGDDWFLKDPNFGMAKWPHVGGLMVGLKKLLRIAYPDFGTYLKFTVWKYER